MNKFKFYFIVIIASLSLFSCTKDIPTATVEPPRDYQKQYDAEIELIENYLKNNYITVIDNPEAVDDQDVIIKKLEIGDVVNKSIWDQKKYQLLVRPVKVHNIEYKLYYLVLRPGVGESPTNVDGVFASYKGTYLTQIAATATTPTVFTATLFEEVKFPQTIQDFYGVKGVITGWSETFPQFKTGTSKINADGTVTHNDFGAGVMFIPSGLAYYNLGSAGIPAYSPLVFSFKLYSIQRLDQDNDGIFSYQEQNELNKDGYIYNYLNTNLFPTAPADDIRYADDFPDNDGIPNFLDIDDDGDNYTTKLEITKPTGKVGVVIEDGKPVNYGPSKYYPYDAFTIADDPSTTVDESLKSEPRGIPAYSATGTPDYTSPNRLRIHLDKDHHTAQP